MLWETEGDHLSEAELLGTCGLLLFAGHETTANLIGNGVLALMQNPTQLNLLQEQPDLIGSAVTELLRYSTSVLAAFRIALEDVQIGDQTIRAGQKAMGGTDCRKTVIHFTSRIQTNSIFVGNQTTH